MEWCNYLIRVNLFLLVCGTFYALVGRRDTFFTVRRFMAWAIYGIAFLYPYIDLNEYLFAGNRFFFTAFSIGERGAYIAGNGEYDWRDGCVALYLIVVAVLWGRLIMQFGLIGRLRKQGEKTIYRGMRVIECKSAVSSFSFFGWIFIETGKYSQKEKEIVLAHEREHIRQYHSLDILMAEMASIFFWYNPGVWSLRKYIRENLEFLADRKVLASGYDRRTYQFCLLNNSCPEIRWHIGNSFHTLKIKKRIEMMNKRETSWRIGGKHIMQIAVICFMLIVGNSISEVQFSRAEKIIAIRGENKKSGSLLSEQIIIVDGRIMPQGFDLNRIPVKKIKNISVIKKQSGQSRIEINTTH